MANPTIMPMATPAPTYAVHLPMVALEPNTPIAPAVVEAPATATSMAIATPVPVAPTSTLEPPTATAMPTLQPTAVFVSTCACDQGNVLNCGDFLTGDEAQACMLRCESLTGRDVHDLDGNEDGEACEDSQY